MSIILSLTVLVAAFNIVSTLIMVVMEKTRDIAILRSMGATRRTIMGIFVYQGLLVGVLGTLLGLLTGVGLCKLLEHYHFIELPTDVYFVSTLPCAWNSWTWASSLFRPFWYVSWPHCIPPGRLPG